MAKFIPLSGPELYQELLACLPHSSFPLPSQVHPHTLFIHALYPFKHNPKPWAWLPGKTEDARHLLKPWAWPPGKTEDARHLVN